MHRDFMAMTGHGAGTCPRSTIDRLDMAEKQVVAVATTSNSGSNASRSEPSRAASSVPLPSSPTPTQSNGPPEHGAALVSPSRAPPFGLALDLPPARRDAPLTWDTWILVGSGEGKETPC